MALLVQRGGCFSHVFSPTQAPFRRYCETPVEENDMSTTSTTGAQAADGKGNADRQKLEDEVKELRSMLHELGKTVGDIGRNEAASFQSKVKHEAQRAADASRDAMHAVGDRAEAMGKDVGDSVKKHPFAAVGIALGVGFLAALVMRR